MSSNKRRRISGPSVVQVRARRPIDKSIISISHNTGTTQINTVLKTATFPGTLVGVRWSLDFDTLITTADSRGIWAIVIVGDGLSASNISLSNGSDMYTPEQNVLAWGSFAVRDSDVGSGPAIMHAEGVTKTMRKLKAGDQLILCDLANTAANATVTGAVQFFFKA